MDVATPVLASCRKQGTVDSEVTCVAFFMMLVMPMVLRSAGGRND
ncbi:hypothetical protein E2C01_100864 [Portunus trituberculatus]|uniref:Uncharacterized protein n=1 Tax=Portunus trituberculatus TaxID=210409 RepID=A0A5B7KKK4_PORTR|nr:hypothetical protein [Portunus trituberculatus]